MALPPLPRSGLAGLLAVALLAGVGCASKSPEPGAEGAAPAVPRELEGAKEWDPERMTELTAELAKAMRAVRNAFRQNPIHQSPDTTKRATATRMMEVLRGLDRHCSALATRVARGATAEETLGLTRRIGTGLRDAEQLGRRLINSAWVDERVLPAMALINEIAPFYGSGPIFDLETMTMIDAGPNPNRRQQSPPPSE